jgi:hypothetical protein
MTDWKGCRRKWPWHVFRYHLPNILVHGLKDTIEHESGRDSNSGSSEYEAEILIILITSP